MLFFSPDPKNILQRLVAELENIHPSTEVSVEDNNNVHSGDKKTSTDIGKKKDDKTIQELFIQIQNEMERVASLGFHLVLVIDGLNSVKSSTKTAKVSQY